MSERIDHLVRRLTEKGQQSLAFFSGLQADAWTRQVYDESGDHPTWTVRDILAHMVSTEGSICKLVEAIAAGGEGAPEDFDVDRFNRSRWEKMKDAAPPDLIAEFRALRARTIEVVATLTDAQLDHIGRHPALGRQELEKTIKVIYAHNGMHERDIRRTLGMEDAAS